MRDLYLPRIASVVGIRDETADVRTLRLECDDRQSLGHRPGQFMEVSVFGIGECPLCVSSAAGPGPAFEHTVRAVGTVTRALHSLKVGDKVGVRGPLGNSFPIEATKGMDVLFVGGGIGLPPLRSLIDTLLASRGDVGRFIILYGARTPSDLVYKDELKEWENRDDVEFQVTVDVAQEGWTGNVGVVTTLFRNIEVDASRTLAFTCGPPIMIRFVIQGLLEMGIAEERIISTLERQMKCGVGKCGHCAIGHTYVCTDGPVFTYKQMRQMGEE